MPSGRPSRIPRELSNAPEAFTSLTSAYGSRPAPIHPRTTSKTTNFGLMAFTVPENLAGTARCDRGVRDWITGLPATVAAFADRWSLRVGEPFQPGGQCSWTAPVTDPADASLVLKVAYRSGPGDDERDEAAGLRAWDGNGAVRLHAVGETELAYALLMERCLPGTPLGRSRPEPEQDHVVAALLRRLWAQPHGAYPFRPLGQMCAAWAGEFERDYAAAGPVDRI